MVPFLCIIIFSNILNNISFMKIKILKLKHQNFNSKLNGLHFLEFIQKYLLYQMEKCPKRNHHGVLSPKTCSHSFKPNNANCGHH